MLATILLLTQIVQSWPGLDSPLVQPGPTICVGECAGPVVWGPAERGRLVVACDMTSDTCSDGRKITTTRATPVPCEVSPGVWEMVPANTGCYSVRGLESWAANTTYLSYGAELGLNPPWVTSGVSVAAVESFWRVCGEEPTNYLQNFTRGEDGAPITASCIVRAATSSRMGIQATHMSLGGSIVDYNLTSEWQTVSATTTLSGGTQAFARILPARSGPGCIDVIACWLTHTSTPGRACWGGEAPVTCAADLHTISTEGWPTEAGEISLIYTPQDVSIVTSRYLVATTGGGAGQPSGFYLYLLSESGALVFGLRRGDTTTGQLTGALAWEEGRSYHVRVRWSPKRAEIWRDGVLLRSWTPTVVPDSQPSVAAIGTTRGGASPAQGSIRAFTVRSYEEVSP